MWNLQTNILPSHCNISLFANTWHVKHNHHNISLYLRRLETGDWDHKLFRKLFTEDLNQSSRLLLDIRQNAALTHFSIGFSFLKPEAFKYFKESVI